MLPAVSHLILQHLCYYDNRLVEQVYYGHPSELPRHHTYKIVIVPARAFVPGHLESMPSLPLPMLGATPLLFGSADMVKDGDVLITHADIVASTFFLVSRYEELLNSERDVHQRFPGKCSILYRENLVARPIVDEYAFHLLAWLRDMGAEVSFPASCFQHIALTHDIDILTAHRRCRGALSSLFYGKNSVKEVVRSWRDIENDPVFCFQWLWQADKSVPHASSLNFVMAQGRHGHRYDYPLYQLDTKDVRYLFHKSQHHHVSIGLHGSYRCGLEPERLRQEQQHLSHSYGMPVALHRHHFLTLPAPEADYSYATFGITDDYSIGFADMVGFRLGTCRPLQRITPLSQKIYDDRLHPLMIMDVTLTEQHYMHLPEEQCRDAIVSIVNQVRRYHGELVTLWHNTSMLNPIHQRLYTFLINYLISL